jgi:hypothetical protein
MAASGTSFRREPVTSSGRQADILDAGGNPLVSTENFWISDGCQHQAMPTDADQPVATHITAKLLHRVSA